MLDSTLKHLNVIWNIDSPNTCERNILKNNCWEGTQFVPSAFGSELSTGGKRFGEQVTDISDKNMWKSLHHMYSVCHYIYNMYLQELFLFVLHLHRIYCPETKQGTKQLSLEITANYTWRSARVRQMIGKKVAAFASFDMLRLAYQSSVGFFCKSINRLNFWPAPGYIKDIWTFFSGHGKFYELMWVLRMEQGLWSEHVDNSLQSFRMMYVLTKGSLGYLSTMHFIAGFATCQFSFCSSILGAPSPLSIPFWVSQLCDVFGS